MTRIIGALLVRDDDLYVERAVRNVFGFCDELILIDNKSKDGTLPILKRLAEESASSESRSDSSLQRSSTAGFVQRAASCRRVPR